MPKKKTSKEKQYRLNLVLSAKVKDDLQDLQEMTNAASATEVIRRALAVYGALVESRERGGATFLRSKDGTEREVLVF